MGVAGEELEGEEGGEGEGGFEMVACALPGCGGPEGEEPGQPGQSLKLVDVFDLGGEVAAEGEEEGGKGGGCVA